MDKIILDFTSKKELEFDFVCCTRYYKNTLVNFIKLEYKGCRDKKLLKNIIENANTLKELESTLNKYGYRLILKQRFLPNINYLYLIKNNVQSLKLYGTKNMLEYVYNDNEYINNDIIELDKVDNELARIKNKTDLSDLD